MIQFGIVVKQAGLSLQEVKLEEDTLKQYQEENILTNEGHSNIIPRTKVRGF